MRLAYRVPEAAEMIGISRSKMYELVKRGVVPSFRIDGMLLVSVRSLEEWITKKEESCG